MFELVKVDKKFSLDPNSLPITIMTFNAMCIYVFCIGREFTVY